MKHVMLAAAAAIGIGGAAEASLVTWNYTAGELTPSLYLAHGEFPHEVPEMSGPVEFSVTFETDMLDGLGQGDVSLHPGWDYPYSSPLKEMHYSISVPSEESYWSQYQGRIESGLGDWASMGWNLVIDRAGNIVSWDISGPTGFGNDHIAIRESDTFFADWSIPREEYAGHIIWRGGPGTWTRSGGDEIFGTVSPVPLPASGLFLIGALGGMGALNWRRKRKVATA